MAMMLKESCCWFTQGICIADHCRDCNEWDMYIERKSKNPPV